MHDTLFSLARRTHVVHFLEENIFFARNESECYFFRSKKTSKSLKPAPVAKKEKKRFMGIPGPEKGSEGLKKPSPCNFQNSANCSRAPLSMRTVKICMHTPILGKTAPPSLSLF